MAMSGDRAHLRQMIDRALDAYLPSEKEEPHRLHWAMRYSVFSGGKRIRPIIVLESCAACGGNRARAVPAACAVECVHTYSLIHDDLPCMDDDAVRRGKPTCHKVFGEAGAVLAGDALLTLAFTIITEMDDDTVVARAVRELAGAIGPRGMVGGQAVDLEYASTKKNIEIVRYINRLKTAKLFEASAVLGALVARAPANHVTRMASFGSAFGMAFQIADDIADKEAYLTSAARRAIREEAKDLVAQAQAALKPFRTKAAPLIAFTGEILKKVA